jgi:hypothetical protein
VPDSTTDSLWVDSSFAKGPEQAASFRKITRELVEDPF